MPHLQNAAEFFLPKYDTASFNLAPVYVPSIFRMRACACTGCPLCIILTASVDISFRSRESLSRIAPVRLARAMIDPHQSVQLVLGMDDCSRTFFYRVPDEWSESTEFTIF